MNVFTVTKLHFQFEDVNMAFRREDFEKSFLEWLNTCQNFLTYQQVEKLNDTLRTMWVIFPKYTQSSDESDKHEFQVSCRKLDFSQDRFYRFIMGGLVVNSRALQCHTFISKLVKRDHEIYELRNVDLIIYFI